MAPTNRFPVPNPVPSFWTSSQSPLDNHRSTSDLPTHSDIVIIGSGYAGVATAHHILNTQSTATPTTTPRITMLEARTACSGATGRNGGHVKPDTYFNVPKYTKLYGAAMGARLAAYEAGQVLAVKTLVETEELDCDFQLTRTLDVYLDEANARETEAAYRELVKAGVVDLKDVAFTGKKDAERISGIKGALACFSFTAAHLWPAKMVRQLLQKLIDKHGLNLQTNTRVTEVSPTRNSKGNWIVRTPRGTIETPKVVFATNGYTASILPQYVGRIVPVRGVASRIVSPKGTETPHLVNTYSLRFGPLSYDYLIPRADGSIVVGGARDRFWGERESWFDNVRDDELVRATEGYFDGYMQKYFRGWEDSGAVTDQVWTGIMGYSSDYMPHLGRVPDKEGQFIIAGFSGHGMPHILLASKAVGMMVRDGVEFSETGLPEVFETTKERLEDEKSPLLEGLDQMWPPKSRL